MNETTTIPCTGEAHSNAWIDNCGQCAPEWGNITVCAGCKHAPRLHAEDGCHAAADDDSMTSARCACTQKFTRKGGKRTKMIRVELGGASKLIHGDFSNVPDMRGQEERVIAVRALTGYEAIRVVRRVLRAEFIDHTSDCHEANCLLPFGWAHAGNVSMSVGGYDRDDLPELEKKAEEERQS